MELLGRLTIGDGPERVIVLHDWRGDHRNYDPMVPYLEARRRSRMRSQISGDTSYRAVARTVRSPRGDDRRPGARDPPRLVAVSPDRSLDVEPRRPAGGRHGAGAGRVLVLLTPVAPTGMGAPEARVGYLKTMTMDDTMRREALASQWGERVSQRWLEVKLRRWSEAALPHASRGYVRACSRRPRSPARRARSPRARRGGRSRQRALPGEDGPPGARVRVPAARARRLRERQPLPDGGDAGRPRAPPRALSLRPRVFGRLSSPPANCAGCGATVWRSSLRSACRSSPFRFWP